MGSFEQLVGRVAVVTGGSSGIGAATARHLASSGADVIIGYNQNEVRAQSILKTLSPGGHHSIARLALEDPLTFEALAKRLRGEFGRLDILINSAGYTRAIAHRNIEALTNEIFEQILVANVRGPYSAIRALHELLRASNDGLIVNVSSISGFTASGSNVAYCAAKAALDNMTMSLARALGPEIRVLSVAPGAVATDFVPGRDRQALEASAKETPLKRVIEADDIADAIVACATHLKASTGSTIIVDGGRRL